MQIVCILSSYIVAALHLFQKIRLQLDDNWLKSCAFYNAVTFQGWQGVVQFSDSIFSPHAEINCYYWPWHKPAGDTFQTNCLRTVSVICMWRVIYHISWSSTDLSFNINPQHKAAWVPYLNSGFNASQDRNSTWWFKGWREEEKNWRSLICYDLLCVLEIFFSASFLPLLCSEGRGAVDEFLSRSCW